MWKRREVSCITERLWPSKSFKEAVKEKIKKDLDEDRIVVRDLERKKEIKK